MSIMWQDMSWLGECKGKGDKYDCNSFRGTYKSIECYR